MPMHNPGYRPGEVTCHTHPDTISQVARALRSTHRTLVLVPTRGNLHAGHRGVIEAAARVPGCVVIVAASSPDDSHLHYQDLDLARLRTMDRPQVALYFSVSNEHLFPHGLRTQTITEIPHPDLVAPPHLADTLTRYVTLCNLLQPDRLFVGERDFHQVVALRHTLKDLHLPVSLTAVQTIRDPNGMAIRDRNINHGDDPQLCLSAALVAGAHQAGDGKEAILRAARSVLDAEPRLHNPHAVLTDYDLNPAPETGDMRLLVTAQLADGTYCHDNAGMLLDPPEG